MGNHTSTLKWAVLLGFISAITLSAEQAQQRTTSATRPPTTSKPTAAGSTTTPATPAPRPAGSATTAVALANQDIIDLAKAGFSEDFVLATIASAKQPAFDVSTRGMLNLKAAGLSERVISVMAGRLAPAPANANAIPPPPPLTNPIEAGGTRVASIGGRSVCWLLKRLSRR